MNSKEEQATALVSNLLDLMSTDDIERMSKEVHTIKVTQNRIITHLAQEVALLKKNYEKERGQLERLFSDMHTCIHGHNNNKTKIQELQLFKTQITSGLEKLVENVGTVVEDGSHELTAKIVALEERVHHNEDILLVTRDDHSSIELILNNFAQGIAQIQTDKTNSTPLDQQLDSEELSPHTNHLVLSSEDNEEMEVLSEILT